MTYQATSIHWMPAALACGIVAATSLPAAGQQPSAPAATIRVEVQGLRNDHGKAGCSLFASADGFASKPEKALRRVFAPIVGGAAVCEFKDVPAGLYAVGAMHDENGDGKMNTNLFGAPTEGHGASRDAQGGFMRGPRFADASFRAPAGALVKVPVPIHY